MAATSRLIALDVLVYGPLKHAQNMVFVVVMSSKKSKKTACSISISITLYF